VERATKHVTVKPGDVAGCRQVGRAYSGGELKIELVHPQQIHPEMEGQETGDYIEIHGVPHIRMQNRPELPGGVGTIATAGNYIPLIGAARAGLLTVLDMPLPRPLLPDAFAGPGRPVV
jgi:4-hydroxy-tetrahydrodipicolinate reductase